MLYLYAATLFVSAVLVFSIQPMVAKMILPRLGGTPAVWNTCMLFFQAALLLGYAYAHWATKMLGARRQLAVHGLVILLPLLVLPASLHAGVSPRPGENPNLWLLAQLALAVGLPFFVLSTSAPLLQKWFARAGRETSRDPYFLYAASNAGSLLALLSYPLLVEPQVGLASQSRLWSGGYLAFVVLVGGCALAIWRANRIHHRDTEGTERVREMHSSDPVLTSDQCQGATIPKAEGLEAATRKGAVREMLSFPGSDSFDFGRDELADAGVTGWRRVQWLLLSFVPSSLMLGVTMHITTDIAPMPLFWVVPLAIYLLAFVLAFARRPLLPSRRMRKPLIFALLGILPWFAITRQPWLPVAIHLTVFSIVCMAFLAALAESRPSPVHLTDFYLWISIGGMLGGVFNSLIAPAVFRSIAEYPLVLAAAAFVLTVGGDRPLRRDWYLLGGLLAVVAAGVCAFYVLTISNTMIHLLVMFALPVLLCFVLRKRPLPFALAVAVLFAGYFATRQTPGLGSSSPLYAGRNFFGVKRVYADRERGLNLLLHGRTIHGCQRMYPPDAEPLAYYSRSGPAGDILAAVPTGHVAVVGLGTGALAGYSQPGQRITFYEIDPEVIAIARDPRLFTYLRDCRGTCDVVAGDARIELAAAPDGQYDAIVLDAFSSDFIPTHLLTREAAGLYVRKLRPNGVLVYHISSRYLNPAPMLAKLAEEMEMVCYCRFDREVDHEALYGGRMPSCYVVMARPGVLPESITQQAAWSRVVPPAGMTPWRDDYSNLLAVLRW